MKEEQKEKQESSRNILHTIEELIPKDAGFIKAEYEGPDIAIYVKDIAYIFSDENIVKSIKSFMLFLARLAAWRMCSPRGTCAKPFQTSSLASM